MTSKHIHGFGRRDILALGAGLAATIASRPPVGALETAPPLRIVDFHNHFAGPQFALTSTGAATGPQVDIFKRNMTDP